MISAAIAQDGTQEINCEDYEFPHEAFSQTDISKVYLAVDQVREGSFKDVGLTKYTTVFGVRVIGHKSVPDDKILHAANLLAQVMDNNQDGVVDHPNAQEQLVDRFASLIVVPDDTFTNFLLSPEEGKGLPNELKFCPFAIDFEEISRIQPDADSEPLCDEFSFDKDRTLAFVTDHIVGRSWPFHFTEDPMNLPESKKFKKMRKFYDNAIADKNFDLKKTGCPEDDLDNCGMVMFTSWATSSMLGIDRCLCEGIAAWKLCDASEMKDKYPKLVEFMSKLLVEKFPDGNYDPSDKDMLILENIDADAPKE